MLLLLQLLSLQALGLAVVQGWPDPADKGVPNWMARHATHLELDTHARGSKRCPTDLEGMQSQRLLATPLLFRCASRQSKGGVRFAGRVPCPAVCSNNPAVCSNASSWALVHVYVTVGLGWVPRRR